MPRTPPSCRRPRGTAVLAAEVLRPIGQELVEGGAQGQSCDVARTLLPVPRGGRPSVAGSGPTRGNRRGTAPTRPRPRAVVAAISPGRRPRLVRSGIDQGRGPAPCEIRARRLGRKLSAAGGWTAPGLPPRVGRRRAPCRRTPECSKAATSTTRSPNRDVPRLTTVIRSGSRDRAVHPCPARIRQHLRDDLGGEVHRPPRSDPVVAPVHVESRGCSSPLATARRPAGVRVRSTQLVGRRTAKAALPGGECGLRLLWRST